MASCLLPEVNGYFIGLNNREEPQGLNSLEPQKSLVTRIPINILSVYLWFNNFAIQHPVTETYIHILKKYIFIGARVTRDFCGSRLSCWVASSWLGNTRRFWGWSLEYWNGRDLSRVQRRGLHPPKQPLLQGN